jgi:hypothetical protein
MGMTIMIDKVIDVPPASRVLVITSNKGIETRAHDNICTMTSNLATYYGYSLGEFLASQFRDMTSLEFQISKFEAEAFIEQIDSIEEDDSISQYEFSTELIEIRDLLKEQIKAGALIFRISMWY